MYEIERKQRILEILRKKKSCSVTELAQTLNYSDATIRRDLNALDREMKIRKTFGGAVILEQFGTEVPLSKRQNENIEVKKRICQAASRLVTDYMTIFLAASTTVEYMIPFLQTRSNLTVVTNNPDIPQKFAPFNSITVYCTGGRFLHHSNSYVGEFAKNMIRQVNADYMFFSARGVSSDGKVTTSSTEDDILQAMLENTAKSCLLVDNSKMNQTYPFTICHLSQVDIIVSEKPLPNGLSHKGLMVV